MKASLLSVLVAFVLAIPSCSKLNSGDSFYQTVGGIEYKFEVIVSKMSFVRLTPVSGPEIVRGDIVIPRAGEYDGHKYVVTQIGKHAFQNYTGITSVTLPKTLSIIEDEAFAGCTMLREINTPQPLSTIGAYAFDGCAMLESFSLEASISELGEGAFRGCSSLRTLSFTPTFTSVPDFLCSGCTSLSEVVLPSTIAEVGDEAFLGCISVNNISIDSSLKTIGSKAFYGCVAVQAISSRTATPPTCFADSFEGVPSGIPVTVPMPQVNAYANAIGWNHFYNFIGQNW